MQKSRLRNIMSNEINSERKAYNMPLKLFKRLRMRRRTENKEVSKLCITLPETKQAAYRQCASCFPASSTNVESQAYADSESDGNISKEIYKKVCIAGAGPVGLLTACLIIDYNHRLALDESKITPIQIHLFERRLKHDSSTNKMIWKDIYDGNNRRNQVVTIQSNVYSELPVFVQDCLFREGNFFEMWPLGPDSPREKGYPRNISIKAIEDDLLALLQDGETLSKLGVKIDFMPKFHTGPLIPEGASDEMVESSLQGVNYVILADGGRSTTESALKEREIIKNNSLEKVEVKNCPVDEVLGIFLDFYSGRRDMNLTAKECMAVTVSQNRFLLNHLIGNFGFLNMWLAPEEAEEAVGVIDADGTKVCANCNQASPCVFILADNQFMCTSHQTEFLPAIKPDESPLMQTIYQALTLYGIPKPCMKEFVKFKLGPFSRRIEFFTDGYLKGLKHSFKVFIVGDAAISVNFRFGRGLNTGIKGALSLTRTIAHKLADKNIVIDRDTDFLKHHGLMSELVLREVMIRSVQVMEKTSSNIHAYRPGVTACGNFKKELEDRVTNVFNSSAFMTSRLSPGVSADEGGDQIKVNIRKLDENFARNLLYSEQWETAVAGGSEVLVPRPSWMN